MTTHAPLAGYVLHRDGGIYNIIHAKAKSSVDGSDVVVYEHVWPFEHGVWIRPLSEWTTDRFVGITTSQLIDAVKKEPQSEAQLRITTTKRARKDLAAKAKEEAKLPTTTIYQAAPRIEASDVCLSCGKSWEKHDFGVPAPFCP